MENKRTKGSIGIVLMTYGSATTAPNVAAYMEHIYKGKASPELIKDFENRYRLVGRSPLIDITRKQAELLEKRLNKNKSAPERYFVRAGMLHSDPFIEEVVGELAALGVPQIKGIILSPQFSSFIMEGYHTALINAAKKHGFKYGAVSVAKAWPTEPHFVQLLAGRVRSSLAKLEEQYKRKIPVLFTTHSLPQRVVDKDPNYLKELSATIEAVVKELNDPAIVWKACYQSAGHTPEEWLKPDLADVLSDIHKEKIPAVLIAPIQFLADHLEILYDLDIAAKEQCAERHIAYHRIELPNTDPLFIEALATL